MYTTMMLTFSAFLLMGVLFNYLLFRQDLKNDPDDEHKKRCHFFTSERLIIFIVEILIAVIGFGVTLSITNFNDRQIEKEKAIHMLEQTIEYTDSQIAKDKSYLEKYSNGDMELKVFLNSNVISLTYYNNILSNELILQNANMKTYGQIMRYMVWLEQADTRAHTATDAEDVYNNLYWRRAYLMKIRDFLWVCYQELIGNLTAEEAAQWCSEIRDGELNSYKVLTPALEP